MDHNKLVFLYWDEPVWKKDEKVKPKNKPKNDKSKDNTSREKGSDKR